MQIAIRDSAFEPYAELLAYQQAALPPGHYGAVVSFVGTLRDLHEGVAVSGMTLEHYPGMTERQIAKVCQEASERWTVEDMLVVHRVGEILPAEPIVLVAVWSSHRADGFDACRYIINFLKQRAPFWKQEQHAGGKRWVEGNSVDAEADTLASRGGKSE